MQYIIIAHDDKSAISTTTDDMDRACELADAMLGTLRQMGDSREVVLMQADAYGHRQTLLINGSLAA